jgi:cell division protein FtsN
VRFDAEAVHRIHKYSRGIPRHINIACDRALTAGFARKAKRIDGEIAAEAIAYLRGAARRPNNRSRRLGVLGWTAAGFLMLLAAAAYHYHGSPEAPQTQTAVPTSSPATTAIEASRNASPEETPPVFEPEPGPGAPPAAETVSQTVAPPLATETAVEPETATATAARPMPAEPPPPAAETSPPRAAAPVDAPEAPPENETVSPATATPAPVYTHSVQVGAFLEEENAGRIASELAAKGYPAKIVPINDPRNRTWHTVRIGDFPSRELAVRRAAEFSAREQRDTAVRPYNAF